MNDNSPHFLLKKYWGYDQFRPLQEEIIQSVIDQKDTLALLTTGGGKSLCFQIPGLILKGITLVVTPLIALMKDQVQQLQSKGIAAAYINSDLSDDEIDAILNQCMAGSIKFLYMAPERIHSEMFTMRVQSMRVALIAIDEAHCISEWGYDFRPSYLNISELRTPFPQVPILALTATATPDVVEDIVAKLQMKHENRFKSSFKRDNLLFSIQTSDNKFHDLVEMFKNTKESAIIYVRNRRLTHEISDYLNSFGISSDYYHAGLESEEKSKKEQQWKSEEIPIIVSTNAFGMGIDKPNVRKVVHYDLPETVEAYYQEAGRAGRDGKEADCILLFNPDYDLENAKKRFLDAHPTQAEYREIVKAMFNYFQIAVGEKPSEILEIDLNQLYNKLKINLLKIYNTFDYLDRSGVLLFKKNENNSILRIIATPQSVENYPLLVEISRTYGGIFSHNRQINELWLAQKMKLDVSKIKNALKTFHYQRIVEYHPGHTNQIKMLQNRDDAYILNTLWKPFGLHIEHKAQKLSKMLQYTQINGCRMQYFTNYFGEKLTEKCGKCDNCNTGFWDKIKKQL